MASISWGLDCDYFLKVVIVTNFNEISHLIYDEIRPNSCFFPVLKHGPRSLRIVRTLESKTLKREMKVTKV